MTAGLAMCPDQQIGIIGLRPFLKDVWVFTRLHSPQHNDHGVAGLKFSTVIRSFFAQTNVLKPKIHFPPSTNCSDWREVDQRFGQLAVTAATHANF